jgi:hypothetical protein
MARAASCAVIFQADKPEKINQIAGDTGLFPHCAAMRYTISCARNKVRQGIAHNYDEALSMLEAQQAGDRGDNLNPPNDLSRDVDRINRENNGNQYRPEYVTASIDVVRRSWARMDNQPYSEYVSVYTPVYTVTKQETRKHERKMGRVCGSLYTQWEDREAETAPDRIASKAAFDAVLEHREKHLRLFFADYAIRLSATAQKRIREIIASTETSAYLASRAGREDKATKQIARAAEYLFANFPYNDNLTRQEYIDLLRQYVTV